MDEDKTNDKPKDEAAKPEDKPVSLVEEAKAVRDEIKQEREKLTAEREALDKLKSDALLSGTAGASVEAPKVSEEDQKKAKAAEFFKDTALGEAIKKT